MAENEPDKEQGEEGEGEKSRFGFLAKINPKIAILVVVCLVLIAASVTGTLFALNMVGGAEDEKRVVEMAGGEAAGQDNSEAREQDRAEADGPAIYYPLKPAIIVNFQARGRQRFLQAELTLLTRDEKVVQAIETHMPMIRNSLVMLFGGQVYQELQTAEGKDRLRQQALEEIRRLLEEEIGRPGVEQVLFTSFVMQ